MTVAALYAFAKLANSFRLVSSRFVVGNKLKLLHKDARKKNNRVKNTQNKNTQDNAEKI
jgi:hypothetical protein